MSSDTEDNDMLMPRIRIKARAVPGHRLLWHVTRPRKRKTFRICRSSLPASTLYPLRLKRTQEIDYLLQSRAGEYVAFSPCLHEVFLPFIVVTAPGLNFNTANGI